MPKTAPTDLQHCRDQAARIESLLPVASQVVDAYLHIKILGVTTNCTYHMNYRLFSRQRVWLGKGSPAEIKAAAEAAFSKLHLLPRLQDGEQLKTYLQAIGLGVDCSGFASWVLNAVTEAQLQKSLWSCLSFVGARKKLVSRLRPVENISANFLTGHSSSVKINDLLSIKPGDLLRAAGGGHVMVITEIGYNADNIITYFQYTHSSCSYGYESGVRTGLVIITKPAGYLLDQQWVDQYRDINPAYELVKAGGADSRVVRLKALANAT